MLRRIFFNYNIPIIFGSLLFVINYDLKNRYLHIECENKYIVSKCNEYTYKLNTIKHEGTWLLKEDNEG